jgi:hypothetical protein
MLSLNGVSMVAVCKCIDFTSVYRGRRGRDCVVVVYPTTFSISAYTERKAAMWLVNL